MSHRATRTELRGALVVLTIVASTSSCQFVSGLVRFETDDAGGGGETGGGATGGADTSGGAGGSTSTVGGASSGGAGGMEAPWAVAEGLVKPADIAIHGDRLYYLERGTLMQSDGAVWTWPLDDSEAPTRLATALDFPSALAVTDDALFFALRSSPTVQRTALPSGTTAPFVTVTGNVRDLESSGGVLYVASDALAWFALTGGAPTPVVATDYQDIALAGSIGYGAHGSDVFRFQTAGNPSPTPVFSSKAISAIVSGESHAFAICNGQLQWRAHDDAGAGTLDVPAARHVAADPLEPGRVFWTNGGEVGTATVAGDDVVVLASGFLDVYGIAVAPTYVYVTDLQLGRVTRVPR